MTKQGVITSEFWWAMAVLIISSALLYSKNLEPEVWAAINGFNGGVYTYSRAVVKKAEINGTNGNVENTPPGGVGTSGGSKVRF